MGATLRVTGTAEFSAKLDKLAANAPKAAAFGVYDGAAVVADAMNNAIKSIRTGKATRDKKRLPSPDEKALLEGSCGVARFQKDGSEVQTLVGVGEGYGSIRGRRKAVKMIANAVESGTSFMKKQPVIRKAARASRAAAQDAMVRTAEKMLEELSK